MITYRDVRNAMVWANNAPAILFPYVAECLDGLMRGYTNVAWDYENISSTSPAVDDADAWADVNTGTGAALNCGDGEDKTSRAIEDFRTYLSALEEDSPWAAFWQGERRIRCLGWPKTMRPPWRFASPYTSGNTSAPILISGNTLDGVTSIRNAHAMSRHFREAWCWRRRRAGVVRW